MQHAAARSVDSPKLSWSGAGITTILFVEPRRRGEKGPRRVEQTSPHVKLSAFRESIVADENGSQKLPIVQWDMSMR